jgi:hypothetical protein
MSDQDSSPDVFALRPFLPAADFETSLRFYVDLGFAAQRFADSLASMQLGPFSFLLQKLNGNWRMTFRFEGNDAILVD